MAVYKEEKTNTWRVLYRYTNWNGERKQSQKRGFKTKREAQAWEREQLNKLGGDLDMNFKSFVEHYSEDMQTRLKENTWETKKHIIDKKLVPYFGKLKMCNITAQQIITWQNELINYKDDKDKPYSPVYLKTMFPVTKSYLYREMERGSKQAGIKRIRIHDIRHSHVSLLIDMGFSATAIADRVGHESIDITYNYAHLFPSKQTEMAEKLDMERGK